MLVTSVFYAGKHLPRLLRRDRVPRLSARLWIVRLEKQVESTVHFNAGVTVRFLANIACAKRMQRHVAALRLKHGRSASRLKPLPRTPCFCASSYSLHPPQAAVVLVTFLRRVQETSVFYIRQHLIDLRNNLISQGKYTDIIDELLVKLTKAKVKKIKVKEV